MRCQLLLAAVVCTLLSAPASLHAEDDWTGDWLFQAAPEGSVPSHPKQKLWRDETRKLVILDGEICLREGQLEMLACPRETKEYESLIVVDAIPGIVHGELMRVGAKPGTPTQFGPYKPATGTEIKVIVAWVDADGKRHAVPAQELIKNTQTGKPMDRGWVFAGSSFVEDPDSGRKIYQGDGGDFISVANFATSTLDLPVKSPQDNASLLFEPMADKVPPEKTKVRLVLVPVVEK